MTLSQLKHSLDFSIPSAFPEGPDGPQIKVISGKSHGVESPVRPLGGCWYFHMIFKKKGTVFQDIRQYPHRILQRLRSLTCKFIQRLDGPLSSTVSLLPPFV